MVIVLNNMSILITFKADAVKAWPRMIYEQTLYSLMPPTESGLLLLLLLLFLLGLCIWVLGVYKMPALQVLMGSFEYLSFNVALLKLLCS